MKRNTRLAEKADVVMKKPITVKNSAPVKKSDKRFRPVDLFVALLCLSVAAVSFNLFRLDLFRTVDSRNQEPVGTVTIRNNAVQRRHQDRVLWDRPFVGAPVYAGDILRIAESSSLGFKREEIEVEYINYQIRRIPPLAPDGTLQIEGNVIVTMGGKTGAVIVNGSRVEAGPGTVIKGITGENGARVQVIQGERVRIIKDGETWERSAGETVGWDAAGTELIEPGVVVTQPLRNAWYQKDRTEPLNVDFVWKRSDLESGLALRLEIAEDRNFTRVIHVSDNFGDTAQAALDDGFWYWRLSYRNTVLATDRFVVVLPESEEAMPEEALPDAPPEEAPPEIPPVVENPPPPPAPPPLFPAPRNLRPARGYRVGIEQLRARRSIDFGWAAVSGANNYIFTLYQQSATGRRQVIRRELGNRTNLTLDNLSVLDRGTFIWQVEAASRRNGRIERRGRPAESSLTVDFPLPATPTLQVEELPLETGAVRGK